MINELLQFMPEGLSHDGLLIAYVVTAVGAILWVAGTRLSRAIITLLLVGAGAFVGLHAPQWWNLNFSGPILALGGALVGGLLGFAMHRMWVALLLGVGFALWASLATWFELRHGQIWRWPTYSPGSDPCSYAREIWDSLPADVMRVLPYAAGVGLVSGLALSILWRRVSIAITWSLIGTTMLVCGGLVSLAYGKPEWMTYKPPLEWAQSVIVLGIFLLGSIVQYRLTPPPRKKLPKDAVDEHL